MQSICAAVYESKLPSYSNAGSPFVINPSKARVLGSRDGGRLVFGPHEMVAGDPPEVLPSVHSTNSQSHLLKTTQSLSITEISKQQS